MRKILLLIIVTLLGVITVSGSLNVRKVTAENGSNGESHIVVEKTPKSSVANGLVERVKVSWPWYLTRVSGLVAAVTLIILMLSGIGLITGHTFSFFEPITAWASHRALGITFAISVLLHVGALYFDNFVPFSITAILVPFASQYKQIQLLGLSVGSLYVALGVVSLYITAAITLTSLLWIEKKPKLWKLTHLLSYLAMIFVFIHALFLGTDLASGILRWVWIGLAFAVMYATIARAWRAKTV
jgi:methionine sulfoxide reductase heme-binding subunit